MHTFERGQSIHKAELLGFLKTQDIRNVIAITGDLHAFQCGVIRDQQDPAAGTPVAVDFVAAGISIRLQRLAVRIVIELVQSPFGNFASLEKISS